MTFRRPLTFISNSSEQGEVMCNIMCLIFGQGYITFSKSHDQQDQQSQQDNNRLFRHVV